MKWILTILAFTSCSFLIVGDRLSESIRTTYVDHIKEISEIYSYLEKIGNKLNGEDICVTLGSKHTFINSIGINEIYMNSRIKRGAFNGIEGFILILDDSSTIDIPAIIQCNVKYKNHTDVKYHGKAYVFYIIIYKEGADYKFDRAMITDITEEEKMVFRLQGADIIQEYQQTYSDRNTRKLVDRWFFKNEENGKKQCEELSEMGLLKEQQDIDWEIINGEIISSVEKKNKKKNRKKKLDKKRTEDFYLRHTGSNEIKLIGIIKCEVKSKISSTSNIVEKYFTITYDNGTQRFRFLYGPVIIDGKQIFDIRPFTNDLPHEQSLSITPTKI